MKDRTRAIALCLTLVLCAVALWQIPGLYPYLSGQAAGAGTEGIAGERPWSSSLTAEQVALSASMARDTYVAAEAQYITLGEDGFSASSLRGGATVEEEGRLLSITGEGVYVLSGTLSAGQIVIRAPGQHVRLVLQGASLACPDGPAIWAREGKLSLICAAGTENSLTGGSPDGTPDPEEPLAALMAAEDLYLTGTGHLSVTGSADRGIYTRDVLAATQLSLAVTAATHGLEGHDAVLLQGATIQIQSGKDAVRSRRSDGRHGYVCIDGGTYTCQAGGDGIDASHRVWIRAGVIGITTGLGSIYVRESGVSRTGIRAGDELAIDGGEVTLDAQDDALHTDGLLRVAGGAVYMSSSDEAIQARDVQVTDGILQVMASVHGLRAERVTLEGGIVCMAATEDGIRVEEADPLPDDVTLIIPEEYQDRYQKTEVYLRVNGGMLYVMADGDCVDARGDFVQTGGFALLAAPPLRGGCPIDIKAGGHFSTSGGTLVATGRRNSHIPQSEDESQTLIQVTFSSQRPAGYALSLQDARRQGLFACILPRACRTVGIYAALEIGAVYLLLGGDAWEEDYLLDVTWGDAMPVGAGVVAIVHVEEAYIYLNSTLPLPGQGDGADLPIA